MKSRQTNRISTSITGSCRSESGIEWDVVIDDLSPTGCRIETPPYPVASGDWVRLTVAGTGPHGAQVAWQRDDQVGLQFARALPDALFRQIAEGKTDIVEPDDRAPSTQTAPVRRIL